MFLRHADICARALEYKSNRSIKSKMDFALNNFYFYFFYFFYQFLRCRSIPQTVVIYVFFFSLVQIPVGYSIVLGRSMMLSDHHGDFNSIYFCELHSIRLNRMCVFFDWKWKKIYVAADIAIIITIVDSMWVFLDIIYICIGMGIFICVHVRIYIWILYYNLPYFSNNNHNDKIEINSHRLS